MLTLYHAPGSFSARILWLLEELDAEYRLEIVRAPMPLDQLVIGVECGASDATSGLTANSTTEAGQDPTLLGMDDFTMIAPDGRLVDWSALAEAA